MLKIKLVEHHRHRNETTFRPYLKAWEYFRDIGIEFVMAGKYDLAWVGQASISDKNHPLERAIRRGIWFIDNKLDDGADYIMFDGQDSASLIGVYEVFQKSNAKLLLKNTLYANKSKYESPSIHGRIYWGSSVDYPGLKMDRVWSSDEPTRSFDVSEYDYSIKQPDFSNIKLSGANWLSTVDPSWLKVEPSKKDIDVFALFSYPAKYNEEFIHPTSFFYDHHRKQCIDQLQQLPGHIKIAILENGKHIPINEYYETMKRSKIVLAPFGYGEIAPRDLEATMVNAILIKPDMSHIETIPNVYDMGVTYFPCQWDFSDLTQAIQYVLENYDELVGSVVENMKKQYTEQYSPEKLVLHMYDILNNLEGYGT